MPPSSACGPTHDFLLVFHVARVAELHEEPDLGWGMARMVLEGEDRKMAYPIDTQERRRSQRVPQSVPLFVRCLDSPFTFSGNLNTVEVSSHGCVIHALRPFPRGTGLHLDILNGHRTTAHVVHSDPIGTGMHLTTWTVALELDKPGDVWMVNPPPPDWSKTSKQQRNRENLTSGTNRDTK
jgi:PilZ domain-containing protein